MSSHKTAVCIIATDGDGANLVLESSNADSRIMPIQG